MSKPYKLSLVSDVRSFLSGIGNVEDALEDAANALDDLGDTGAKAGDHLDDALTDTTRSLKDLGDESKTAGKKIGDGLDKADTALKDTSKTTDKLERKFSDAVRSMASDSKTAGKKIGDGVKDGTDKATAGVEDFRDEAKDSAREASASFTGSFEDVGDLVQEVAANAFAGFGPLGAAAGMAAAAGIGILVSKAQAASEKINEAKDAAIELANELADTGGDPAALDWATRMRDTLTQITDDRQWWEFWQDEPTTRIEEWSKAATEFGLNVSDMVKGAAGDTEAMTRVQDQLTAAYDDATTQVEAWRNAGDQATQTQKQQGSAAEDTRQKIAALRDDIQSQADTVAKATDLNNTLTEALSGINDAASEAAEATQTYTGAVVDDLTSAGQAWQDYADGGKVNLDAYNANIEAHVQAVQDFESNLVRASSDLSNEALDYIRSMGPAAAPLLQAFVDAPLGERRRTAQNWDTLGRAATDGYAQSLDLDARTRAAVAAAQRTADNNPIRFHTKIDNSLQSQVNTVVWSIRAPSIPVRLHPVASID